MITVVVDPGDTSGVAIFSEDGRFVERWQAKFEQLCDDLSSLRSIQRIIVEDYRLRKGKQSQQTGSRFPAVQVIGVLKYIARQQGADFILESVQAKQLGSMYSGVKPPSNHSKSHEIDAYNIGIYWLVKEGRIEPPAAANL